MKYVMFVSVQVNHTVVAEQPQTVSMNQQQSSSSSSISEWLSITSLSFHYVVPTIYDVFCGFNLRERAFLLLFIISTAVTW